MLLDQIWRGRQAHKSANDWKGIMFGAATLNSLQAARFDSTGRSLKLFVLLAPVAIALFLSACGGTVAKSTARVTALSIR